MCFYLKCVFTYRFVCVCQCFSVFVSARMSYSFSPLSCKMSTIPSNGVGPSVVWETQFSCDMHVLHTVWLLYLKKKSKRVRNKTTSLLTDENLSFQWERIRKKINTVSVSDWLYWLQCTYNSEWWVHLLSLQVILLSPSNQHIQNMLPECEQS